MNSVLTELVRISKIVGADVNLVLGSFGNTSVKTGDGKFMYIKASGTALKDMTQTKGWRKLKLAPVRDIFNNNSIATAKPETRLKLMTRTLVAACDDPLCRSSSEAGKFRTTARRSRVTPRPSVESCFHSILGRYVIHLHPAVVLAYACAKDGREKIQALFRNKNINPVWIPYANPGFELAKKIKKTVGDYKTKSGREPEVLVLQNHGLVVSAESSKRALALVRKTVHTCRQSFNKDKKITAKSPSAQNITQAASMIRNVLIDFAEGGVCIDHFFNRNITAVLKSKNISKICSGSAVTPDELVYANGPALYLEEIDAERLSNLLRRKIRQKQRLPRAFLVKSLGLFVAEQKSRVSFVRDVVEMYLRVRSFSQELGGIYPLSKKSCEFIIRNYG